jgi:phage portal protein BeeE
MALINPSDILNALFGTGSREYYKTPKQSAQSQILTGEAQFLNPDTWNPHNIFMTTPQLYAVINRKGYLLASGIWKHYKTDRNGKVVEVENSPYVKLLENPNPLVHGNDLIRQWNENKCVFGNNYEYVLKAFANQDLPDQLTNIDPTTVGIKTSGKYYKQTSMADIIQYYEIFEKGNSISVDKLPPNEVNHSKMINSMNAIKGESPMIPIHMPISNIRASYQFRNVIMTKKGALGLLTNASKDSSGAVPLLEPERKRIDQEYQRQYGIGDDQSKLIMTNASLSWQAMTFPTKDLMLFEEISEDFLTIIDNYGLNANIFSRNQGATFENMNEGLKQAYQSTIIPEAEELAMARSKQFNLLAKGEFLELCYDHIPVLQENEKEEADVLQIKANAIKTLAESGLFTSDEIKLIVEIED